MPFGQDKPMYDVDLTCAKCGAHISQLPFQPTGDRKVYCNDCNRAYWADKRGSDRGGFGGGASRGPKQMFDVNVACADCGKQITQLPFVPKGDKPVYCSDCLRAQRGR